MADPVAVPEPLPSALALSPGSPHPLGAVYDGNGVNFCIYCGSATAVALLLYERSGDTESIRQIQLDPVENRTFLFWHIYVKDLRPGAEYAFRVHGPRDLHGQGNRYDWNKGLADPYARANDMGHWDRVAATMPPYNAATCIRSVVVDTSGYDWEGDAPLNHPMNKSIIYEMHVGGFTRSPSAAAKHPGTFLGVTEKIPYLQDLGVTAVELLPTFQFDPNEDSRVNPLTNQRLSNYWGYSTIGFFCPHPGYCVSPSYTDHIREFREMVKSLHRAGIEVILDVVFNHTGEGNEKGPIISFRGLDNASYYMLRPENKELYLDFSGCGNTVNCNHPIVMKLILDSLEFWVREMHVDGFRFDEASIMSRGEDGVPLVHPPVIWAIELSEVLANTKVIAEAWDAAGLYEVGRFPGHRWAVWNGHFRDDVRRFVRGDPGMIGSLASRICGSADVFSRAGSVPINSVNFITCHDGFTLYDLVSYDEKHNIANGEDNRDGANDNMSWNCGFEGPTRETEILTLRTQQMKNFIALLLLSQGVPMLLAGDEVRRSQGGNNNAYCQDNEIGWFDWGQLEQNRDMYRFVKLAIAFRKLNPSLLRGRFFTGEVGLHGLRDISWHGRYLHDPAWSDSESRYLAFTLTESLSDPALHVMLNMAAVDANFELPSPLDGARRWYIVLDTSRPSPNDILEAGHEEPFEELSYLVRAHSVVVLLCNQISEEHAVRPGGDHVRRGASGRTPAQDAIDFDAWWQQRGRQT